jgi:hypothetical protein
MPFTTLARSFTAEMTMTGIWRRSGSAFNSSGAGLGDVVVQFFKFLFELIYIEQFIIHDEDGGLGHAIPPCAADMTVTPDAL